MKDIYVMNKNTGEIVPSMEAIGTFYKTHKWSDAWTDEWTETEIEVENSSVPFPNFENAIKT